METPTLPSVLFVPEGKPIPCEYTVVNTARVPAIRREDVTGMVSDLIDVTSIGDETRQFIDGEITLQLTGGKRWTASRDLIDIALHGGGTFQIAHLNPIEGPETREQWEAAEELRIEDEAREASEYEDYADDDE